MDVVDVDVVIFSHVVVDLAVGRLTHKPTDRQGNSSGSRVKMQS